MLYKINATNARGQVIEEERGNGAITHYEYDPVFGRKTRQSAGITSWLPIQDIAYKWDILGNLDSFPRIPMADSATTTGIITAVVAAVITLGGAILGGMAGMKYHRRVDSVGLGDERVVRDR